MRRFYFDLVEDLEPIVDLDGRLCADIMEARHEALISITNMANERIAIGMPCRFAILVRDGPTCLLVATVAIGEELMTPGIPFSSFSRH